LSSPIALGVCAGLESQQSQAEALSTRLHLPLLDTGTDPARCRDFTALLVAGNNGLSLVQTGPRAPGPVQVDFGGGAMRHRRKGGHNELLGKAVGVGRKQNLHVLDATAGLGRDAFVLADLGCRLTLCEREPVIAAMLDAAIVHSERSEDPWQRGVVSRISLVPGDATVLSLELVDGVDVIYLDPMFPPREKHAAVKKEMALFQQVLFSEKLVEDADALQQWALSQDVARVVIKRPRKAPALGQAPVSHVISGKAVRYDVYVRHSLNNNSPVPQ
jgi:16S rRNA (guanine1516-N2)-methyltransferase